MKGSEGYWKMDRKAYNECLSPWIKGKGIDKEERKLRFCTGAKVCSGKAKDEKEAIELCKLPKPVKEPKPTKRRGGKANCEADMSKVAACIVGKVTANTTTDDIIKILVKCHCGKNPTRVYAGDVAGAQVADAKQAEEKEKTLALIAQLQNQYGTG